VQTLGNFDASLIAVLIGTADYQVYLMHPDGSGEEDSPPIRAGSRSRGRRFDENCWTLRTLAGPLAAPWHWYPNWCIWRLEIDENW